MGAFERVGVKLFEVTLPHQQGTRLKGQRYAKLKLEHDGDNKFTSRYVDPCLTDSSQVTAQFSEQFEFHITDFANTLIVKIMSTAALRDKMLGRAKVDLRILSDKKKRISDWFPLHDDSGNSVGQVHMLVTATKMTRPTSAASSEEKPMPAEDQVIEQFEEFMTSK
ncbi:MAG: hypothetical protein MHM6MM_007322, partial [Cercozoa sp. M6MM]